MATELRRKSFVFTWKLRNFKFASKEWISSPCFSIDTFESVKWNLSLNWTDIYPDSICLYIDRGKLGNCSKVIDLDYSISVFSDGSTSPQFEKSSSYTFKNNTRCRAVRVPKHAIFESQNETLLPDVLTIRCEIWKKQEYLYNDGECTVIAEQKVVRQSFDGVLENFSCIEANKAAKITLASNLSSEFFTSIAITHDEKIYIAILPLCYKCIEKFHCVIYLLGVAGEKMKCGDDWFACLGVKPLNHWIIPLNISKRKIMHLNEQYLTNNRLSLKFEIEFSTGDIIYNFKEDNASTHEESNTQDNTEAEDRGMSTVKDDLATLLSTGMLSDIKLQTATETLPAHKIILSARSKVFRAMFTNDMQEKIKDCVEIEDLDAETVRRLLLFLYSDAFEDMNFESAMKLYFAADKYEVLALKYKCSLFLQENLAVTNCCDVLMLADRHNDSDLKKKAQRYIEEHDKCVVETEQWKRLGETNPHLGFEALHIMLQKYWKNTCH